MQIFLNLMKPNLISQQAEFCSKDIEKDKLNWVP